MFEGSYHVKSGDHFKIVNAPGGELNGTNVRRYILVMGDRETVCKSLSGLGYDIIELDANGREKIK